MGTREHRTRTLAMPALFAFILFFGCVPFLKETETASTPSTEPVGTSVVKETAEREKGKPVDLMHTVQWKGESLSIIAKWYTGNIHNWKLLAEYNPLNNPDRIRIGNSFFIPEALLITRVPMPKSFVDNHQQQPEKDGPAETPPELFGPRDLSVD